MAVMRMPLAATLGEREPGDTSDPLLVNCYKETVREADVPGKDTSSKIGEDVIYVTKRPGLKSYDDLSAASTDTGRGITNWDGTIYTLLGDELFADETDLGTLNTSSGRVQFDIAFDAETAGGEDILVTQDGASIYMIQADNTISSISDEAGATVDIENLDFAMIPGIVNLDQYVFVADDEGFIYNSTVGDLTSTTSFANALNMELKRDKAVAISRYINYLVGFGEDTLEVFYNTGESGETGSPLQRYSGMSTLIGCAAAHSVVNVDQALMWVAKSPDGGRFVAMINKGFDVERISTTAIDEILDKEGANISNAYAFFTRHAGKKLYILTLPTTAARTFVYDMDELSWYEWTSDVSDTESYFTGIASAELQGTQIILDEDNGLLYDFDAETYQDQTGSNETIKVELRTKKLDMGTMQNKFIWRLQAIGDLNSSSGTINIAWSDDDYQSFSTNRTQDLDNHQSWLTRCGMFKRRAFRIQHQQNLPMRLSHLEANGDTGHYARS